MVSDCFSPLLTITFCGRLAFIYEFMAAGSGAGGLAAEGQGRSWLMSFGPSQLPPERESLESRDEGRLGGRLILMATWLHRL